MMLDNVLWNVEPTPTKFEVTVLARQAPLVMDRVPLVLQRRYTQGARNAENEVAFERRWEGVIAVTYDEAVANAVKGRRVISYGGGNLSGHRYNGH